MWRLPVGGSSRDSIVVVRLGAIFTLAVAVEMQAAMSL